ncbi:hypothetical protein JL722_13314 [Aureococcus anophagefferens]|nr:hypothetical protein JL722_13314 [Aureococcus anophagefferens]
MKEMQALQDLRASSLEDQIVDMLKVGRRRPAARPRRAAPRLSADYINRKLFDALLLGFGDANDDARLLTLMAMLAIAPRLNEKNRTDRLLRLSEQLRHKVVLPAFVKALDDKIPSSASRRSARSAANVFNAQIGARLIAPKLVPLAVDVNGHVRDAAIPCLEAYLSEQAAEKRVAEVEAAKHAPPPPAAAAAPAAAEAAAPARRPAAGGGWASWAVGKVGAPRGRRRRRRQGRRDGRDGRRRRGRAGACARGASSAARRRPAPSQRQRRRPGDGWGDDDDAAGSPKAAGDGWGGDGWGDEPAAPPPKKASPRPRRSQRPTAGATTGATTRR